MRNNYREDAARLDAAIAEYERSSVPLPGLAEPGHREVLIQQLIDSEQRVLYTDRLLSRPMSPASADPRDESFDPLRAAVLHARAGDLDEAMWLVYLFVHFGKHRYSGWRYIRYVYGAFGSDRTAWWTWERTSNDVTSFRYWLDEHQDAFHSEGGRHGFGNHRKYVSLDAWKPQGTGAAIESYVDWIHAAGGGHRERFASLTGATPEDTFDAAYASLKDVIQFGRTARFDYLTMTSKLELFELRPPHSYIVSATGPLTGARLLLRGDKDSRESARVLQAELKELGIRAGIRPDVLEDAICNWQKRPADYLKFSG